MLLSHGSRTATHMRPSASPVTPNWGWLLNRLFPRDVLVSGLTNLPDRVAHRPGDDSQPVCVAFRSASWDRIPGRRAKTHGSTPCHDCYPQGWSR
jgi:hypothetical protein